MLLFERTISYEKKRWRDVVNCKNVNENMIELERLWHSNAIFSGNKNDVIVKEKMYMIYVEMNVGAERKTIFY